MKVSFMGNYLLQCKDIQAASDKARELKNTPTYYKGGIHLRNIGSSVLIINGQDQKDRFDLLSLLNDHNRENCHAIEAVVDEVYGGKAVPIRSLDFIR